MFEWIKIRVRGIEIGVFAFGFLCAISVLSNESARTSDGDGESVFEAFNQSQSAINFYDVRVKRWSSVFPTDFSTTDEYPSIDERSVCRMIIKHDEKKCFVFSRTNFNREATKEFAGKMSITRNIYLYIDGKMTTTRPEKVASKPSLRQTNFMTFLDVTQIDYPAFIGRQPLYYSNASHMEKELTDQAPPGIGLNLDVFPDGLLRLRSIMKPDSIFRSETLVDPKTFAPKKMSLFLKEKENWNLAYEHEMEYDERESMILPIRGNFSYSTRLANRENRNLRAVAASQVGGVELEWLKVNESTLEFPDWKKIGSSVAEFEKFLDPSQFEGNKNRSNLE